MARATPAIGQAAAIGMALTAAKVRATKPYALRARRRQGPPAASTQARPTAINLRWAVERVMAAYDQVGLTSQRRMATPSPPRPAEADVDRLRGDRRSRASGVVWAWSCCPGPKTPTLHILTHCNTGPPAGGQLGTGSLSPSRPRTDEGRDLEVFVDETWLNLQGARLTTCKLAQAGVPTKTRRRRRGTWMARGEGPLRRRPPRRPDRRPPATLPTKAGTYTLAVLAASHRISSLVAAPISTVDLATPTGILSPPRNALTMGLPYVRGTRFSSPDTEVRNPVGPTSRPRAQLITAIVTDEGAFRAPFEESRAGAGGAAAASPGGRESGRRRCSAAAHSRRVRAGPHRNRRPPRPLRPRPRPGRPADGQRRRRPAFGCAGLTL